MSLVPSLFRRFTARIRRFLEESYTILYSSGPSWHELRSPRHCFYADPFIIEDNGAVWVFFEEFLYSSGKGRIACAEITTNGHILRSRVVLEKEYHLSFPFVFRADNSFWMIPETSGNETIDIYSSQTLGGEWTLAQTIRAGLHAVDSIVHRIGEYWWLFCFAGELPNGPRHLEIFYASELLTQDWKRHPVGEQKMYIGGLYNYGRNAGPLFFHEGLLIRPAQRNVNYYGEGITYYNITELSPTTYREVPYDHPSMLTGNLHHISFSDTACTVDRRTRTKWYHLFFPHLCAQSLSSPLPEGVSPQLKGTLRSV